MRLGVPAVFAILLGCTLVRDPPPPPPPAPPGITTPPATVAVAVAPPPTAIAGAVPVPPATGGPTPVMVPTTGVTGVAPPPTTMLPGGHVPSAICQRAAHCCGTAASRAPRGIPRHGHSPRELLMAHDGQCAQALGMCAEAFMEFGERPPDYCRQPGRHAEAEPEREW